MSSRQATRCSRSVRVADLESEIKALQGDGNCELTVVVEKIAIAMVRLPRVDPILVAQVASRRGVPRFVSSASVWHAVRLLGGGSHRQPLGIVLVPRRRHVSSWPTNCCSRVELRSAFCQDKTTTRLPIICELEQLRLWQ